MILIHLLTYTHCNSYIAIDDGPMCPQRNSVYRSTEDIGTEDCLRVNVYVPQMVKNNNTNGKCVLGLFGWPKMAAQ